MTKLLGLVGMVGLLLWALHLAAGIRAYIDLTAVVFVFGGAVMFAVAIGGLKQSLDSALEKFGAGSIYFGWLGFLIGLVAIFQSLDAISDEEVLDVTALGAAMGIATLTILYGYVNAWVLVPVLKELNR